jgi:hypothetical protein
MYRNETRTGNRAPHAGREPRTYVVEHDFDGPAELTTTLVHALSNVSGVDVTDTEFTLNDYVDPEALDALFKPKGDGEFRMSGRLSFTAWGYRVTVYSDGRIAIVPPEPSPAPRR